MKKYLLILTALLLTILFAFKLNAQPKVSYIFPDIGAPGMNVYVELVCPFDPANMPASSKNFGPDGFLFNNPGDIVRLECVNPNDTSMIVIGPIIVSWDGRMVSSQIFIKPSVNPNSWDQTRESGHRWRLRRPAPRVRFTLHHDVSHKCQGKKNTQLCAEGSICDERSSRGREKHKSAGDRQAEPDPVPDKQRVQQLRRRLAPLGHAEQAAING